MAITPLKPDTATGVVEHAEPSEHVSGPVLVPSPSSPSVLVPQHSTVPPESSAQVDPPAATAVTFVPLELTLAPPLGPVLPPDSDSELFFDPALPQAAVTPIPAPMPTKRKVRPTRLRYQGAHVEVSGLTAPGSAAAMPIEN